MSQRPMARAATRIGIAALLSVSWLGCGSEDGFFYLPTADAIGDGTTEGDTSSDASTSDTDPTCTDSVDCAGGQVCESGRCRDFCAEDVDCVGSASICETSRGVCVGCITGEQCDDGQRCDDGECVTDGATCTAGATRCENGGLETCIPSGTAWALASCPSDAECVEREGSASCASASECTPFETGCLDVSTAFECSPDGSRRVPVACGDLVCVEGACEEFEAPCVLVDRNVFFDGLQLGDEARMELRVASCGGLVTLRDVTLRDGMHYYLEAPSLPRSLIEPLDIDVWFAPQFAGELNDTLLLEFDEHPDVEVSLRGEAYEENEDCPIAVATCRVGAAGAFRSSPLNVEQFDTVVCTSADSEGAMGDIQSSQWRLVRQPSGSTTTLSDANQTVSRFVADREGAYRVELHVTDTLGNRSCRPALFDFDATAVDSETSPLRVELSWTAGLDFDVYLRHPSATRWRDRTGTCYWDSMNPDWGVEGRSADNPFLDMDAQRGPATETISLASPETGQTYRVGVHLSTLSSSAQATVRVFDDDELLVEASRDLSSGQLWEPVTIRYSGASGVVSVVDTIFNATGPDF